MGWGRSTPFCPGCRGFHWTPPSPHEATLACVETMTRGTTVISDDGVRRGCGGGEVMMRSDVMIIEEVMRGDVTRGGNHMC